MKTHNIGNTGHSINFRKLAKPAALCIIAIFVISMLSVFASTGVQAATTTLALHTSGDQILDSNNNVVYLRGIGVAGMTPDLFSGDKEAATAGATNGNQHRQHP